MTSFLPIVSAVPIQASEYENVYQVDTNTRKARTPVINSQTVKIALPSKSFSGGAYNIELPLGPLLSHSLMCFKLDKTKLPLNAVLEKGWGYRILDYIEFQSEMGTFLRFPGRNMLIKALEDCETDSKRDAVMELGGQAWNGNVNDVIGDELIAYVHIYLPFSNLSASRVIPYDSGLLSKPWSLNLYLRSADKVFTTNALSIAAGINPPYPSEFVEAYFVVQTSLMSNGPSAGIRDMVKAGSSGRYAYGWMYPAPFISEQFKGSSDKSNPCRVRLNNFQNGGLQSMSVWLERLTLGNVAQTRYADVPNASNRYEDMSEITLYYGGQVVYRSSDDIYKLMSLSEYTCVNNMKVTYPNAGTTSITAEASKNTATSTWVHIQFSQFNENHFTNLVQDSIAPTNNMFEITFTTPKNKYLRNGGTGVQPVTIPASPLEENQPQYRLHCNYNYLSSITTMNGKSDIQFLPSDSRD
jgi:hypothetical protein